MIINAHGPNGEGVAERFIDCEQRDYRKEMLFSSNCETDTTFQTQQFSPQPAWFEYESVMLITNSKSSIESVLSTSI